MPCSEDKNKIPTSMLLPSQSILLNKSNHLRLKLNDIYSFCRYSQSGIREKLRNEATPDQRIQPNLIPIICQALTEYEML